MPEYVQFVEQIYNKNTSCVDLEGDIGLLKSGEVFSLLFIFQSAPGHIYIIAGHFFGP